MTKKMDFFKRNSYGFLFLISLSIAVLFMMFGDTLSALKFKNTGTLFGELDSSGQFYLFMFNYKNLINEGEFPLWNFFTLYGHPQKFWYFTQSPILSLVSFIGWGMDFQNVWNLFRAAIVLEQSLLIFGLFLIAQHLRIPASAALLVSTALVISDRWFIEYYFHHHTITGFAVVAYYFIRYADRLQAKDLGLAGFFMCLFLFGGTHYQGALMLYQSIILLFILLIFSSRWKNIKIDKQIFSFLPAFIAAIVIAVTFYIGILASDIFSGTIHIYRSGRNEEMTMSFNQFVSGSEYSYLLGRTFEFIVGYGFTSSLSSALGTVMAVFVFYGLMNSRTPLVKASLIIVILSLAVLSGKIIPVSYFYYLLPGMDFYRGPPGFFAYTIFFAGLIAMIGFGDYIQTLTEQRPFINPLIAVAIFVSVLSPLWLFTSNQTHSFPIPGEIIIIYVILPFSFLGLLFLVHRKYPKLFSDQRVVGSIVTLLIVLNIATAWSSWIFGTTKYFVDHSDFKVLNFEKKLESRPYRNNDIPKVTDKIIRKTSYNSIYFSALKLLPCSPGTFSNHTAASSIDKFFKLYGNFDNAMMSKLVEGNPKPRAWINNDKYAKKFLGCNEPIFRLSADVVTVSNDVQAVKYMRKGKDVIALRSGTRPSQLKPGNTTGIDKVTLIKFSANQIDLEVSSTSMAWLIVADAFDPHWVATVNGRTQPVHRANIGFKGIYVPSGTYYVNLSYRDPVTRTLIWGVTAGGATIISIAMLAWIWQLFGWIGLPRSQH